MYKEPRLKSNVYVITYLGTVEKQLVIEKDIDGFTVSNGKVEIKYHFEDYKETWFSDIQDIKNKYKVLKQGDKIYIQPKPNYFMWGNYDIPLHNSSIWYKR